jgi:3-methyladenine DNA glycosylase AlkD
MVKKIQKELRKIADGKKAKDLRRFFKTGPGEYAAGDKFLGVMVPQTRLLVKKYWREISIDETQELLRSQYHEERLAALLIMVKKFEKSGKTGKLAFAKAMAGKKEIFDLYLANTKFINNWDLVDLSAPNIVGAYLKGESKKILFELAGSKNLWERRIAILATFAFIKNKDAKDALKIAELLVNDDQDLVHKAVGWMLREAGKRCGQEIEEEFLRKHCKIMPRTMLRYAIERFDDGKRNYYLKR